MVVNINSLHARLLNLAHEKKIDWQILLNRLAAEQFLYRLSLSPYAEKFIFKGGSLLSYLIDSDRKTKDLDFSMREVSNQVEAIVAIIKSVVATPLDDGITWGAIEGAPLEHPDMDLSGVRIACRFLFGKAKGVVRLDMALGDVVEAIRMPLTRMQYKNEPIFGEPFSLLVSPPETVFAEKFQIALKKGGQNTRMKDYYDLTLLIDHDLDLRNVRQSVQDVLKNRGMELITQLAFTDAELAQLQTYWEHFCKRERMTEAPARIATIIDKINAYLKKIYA